MITIDCFHVTPFGDYILYLFPWMNRSLVKKYGCVFTKLEKDRFPAHLTVDGIKATINTWKRRKNYFDVCVVGWEFYFDNEYINSLKNFALVWKQVQPNAPIILVGDSTSMCAKHAKDLELAGRKAINRKMGEKIASDIGAVKYIEMNRISGRGCKLLFEEIFYAYFVRLQDLNDEELNTQKQMIEKEQELKRRKLTQFEKERQEKIDRDLILFLIAALVLLISSIILNAFTW